MPSDLFSLEGRLALVTGSSQGIGLALAEGLASHGASVVLNGRSAAKMDEAVKILAGKGHAAHGAVFDVTERAAVEEAVTRIERDIGTIDILVNNAGMQFRAPLEDFPEDKWQEMLQTNISSVFFVGQAVARRMIPRRRGKIVNIASVQSELARPAIAPYTATKGAVRNLTRGMCTDWARHGLQVNAIAPAISGRRSTRRWSTIRNFQHGWRSARRLGAGATSRNLSARRCFLRPTRPPSSTVMCSMSMAASRLRCRQPAWSNSSKRAKRFCVRNCVRTKR